MCGVQNYYEGRPIRLSASYTKLSGKTVRYKQPVQSWRRLFAPFS